jgi:hypothetical protein
MYGNRLNNSTREYQAYVDAHNARVQGTGTEQAEQAAFAAAQRSAAVSVKFTVVGVSDDTLGILYVTGVFEGHIDSASPVPAYEELQIPGPRHMSGYLGWVLAPNAPAAAAQACTYVAARGDE